MADSTSRRTICFPIIKEKILLGMKLKGFGSGKYNGFGGKFDGSFDTSIEDTALRELQEESGLSGSKDDLRKVAVIDFRFPANPKFDQIVTVYFIEEWRGTAQKTQEMEPVWFEKAKMPYDKMWDSDRLWMPALIEGKKFEAKFIWEDDNETVKDYSITYVEDFD